MLDRAFPPRARAAAATRSRRLLLGVVVLSAVLALLTPANAYAVTNCPDNSICLYQHRDFGGLALVIPAGGSYASLHTLSCPNCESSAHHRSNGTWGDQMSSWSNKTGLNYCWWWDINFSNAVSGMLAGTDVAYVGSFANDQASSIQPC